MVSSKLFETDIVIAAARGLPMLAFFFVAITVRTRVAKLSDSDLSDYLSMSVLKGGLLTGLGQILFLSFSAIQCEREINLEGHPWVECKRSLMSQAGEI